MVAVDTFLKRVVQGADERPYSNFWQGAKEVARELLGSKHFDAREVYVREWDNFRALASDVPDDVYQRAFGRYRLAREVARRFDPCPPSVPEVWCETCNTPADIPEEGPCDGCLAHYVPDPAFEVLDKHNTRRDV